jgi:hypothetical protein
MADTIKILVFNNEMEAHLLAGILDEKKIPYMLRSYHDSVYDGLWQTQSCWGHLEAPPEFKDEILRIFAEMSEPGDEEEAV